MLAFGVLLHEIHKHGTLCSH